MKILKLIFIISFLFSGLAFSEEPELKIQKYTLKQEKNNAFPYGSGLAFKKASNYGGNFFYLIPSGRFTITDGRDGRVAENIPHVMTLKQKKKKLKINQKNPLVYKKGDPIEVDLEGIATAPDKSVWLVNEFDNSILQTSMHTGEIINIYRPGKELPKILKESQINRGLEGIAVTPNGKVYAVLQSVLDVNSETAKTAQFIRLVEYDSDTNSSRMYAIPFDSESYISSDSVKIGDIQALDNQRFIIVEQGQGAVYQNNIYLIDISQATDISKLKYDNKELEYISDPEILFADSLIKNPIQKKHLLDLRKHDWKLNKVEGLTLVDASTIAIINDWDDGVDYNELWLITLPEPLIGWTWKEWALMIIVFGTTLLGCLFALIFAFKKENQ